MQPCRRLEDFFQLFSFYFEKKFSCETIGTQYALIRRNFRDQPYNLHILRIMSFTLQLTNGFGLSYMGGNIWYLCCSKWVSFFFFLRKMKLLWIWLFFTWKPMSCCHFRTFKNSARKHSVSQTTVLVNRRKYSHNLKEEFLPRKLRKQLAFPSGLGSSSSP